MTAGSNVGQQKPRQENATPASVAAYVDCALEASEVLPASLVPHITDARLLDVQFCAITRRLESLLANRQQNQQTHENGSTSADFDGEMTHLLLALQENADAKLRCVEMVNGMLRDKVDQLDQCKRIVVSGDTNINRQAGTPSIGEPGWGIVPRNQETTERRPISRATAAALEKDSQQNTPAFGHNANNYGNFSACSDGKESAGRPQKRRRVIRGKTTTQSQTNVSNDSTKDEDISGQNISFQNRSRLNTPVAGSGDAGGAGSRCVSEAPSLASSGHAPTTGARRGKRQKQSNSRLPSPASASKSSNSDFQGKIGEGAKRGRKQTQNRDKDLDEDDTDVDEETYCFCEQVSYGDMICCDYASCVIEWFHFGCVGVSAKPKGKWYCPNCRGDKPTVLKSGLGGKGKG